MKDENEEFKHEFPEFEKPTYHYSVVDDSIVVKIEMPVRTRFEI